jgi:phospholipid/cholesterol/gamma-HCH transport system substrate-binding protein
LTGGRGHAGGPSTIARVVAAVLVVVAVAVVAYLLFAGGGGYHVKAVFVNAGQLVEGNQVQAGGVAIGSVQDIAVTQDGRAEVTLEIDDDDYKPLRRGTRLLIRPTSLSGIANRFVDVQVGPDDAPDIPDGGRIDTDETQSAVELDSVFSVFDPRTRRATQDFIAGQAEALRGRGRELQAGVRYLNPALSTGSRLFGELSRDNRLLRDFLLDSSDLVTALGERRRDLTGVVRNLNLTFRALGSQQAALAESIERLPPFLRRANTTFVNLRAALDDVDPLVNAAKPVARSLGPFLEEARGFARDAVATVRDLSRTISSPGRDNDLIDLVDSFPPLAGAALDPRRVNGATRPGAFPETSDALRAAAPTIAQGRPYTPELVGWMDDFAATGAYDALGGFSRAWLNFSELLYGPGPKLRQFRRCPGANEQPASDRSNVLTASEQAALDCDGSQRSVGP